MWTINGIDPNTYGLKVSGLPGWETAPAIEYLTQRVPGRPGNLLLRTVPDLGPRRIEVQGVIKGTSNADLLAKFDNLKALFSKSSLAVIMNNRNTRQLTCRLDGEFQIDAVGAHLSEVALPVSFALVADDPFWYDTTNTVISNISAGGASAAPAGTAPSWPVFTGTTDSGGSANLALSLYKNTGAFVTQIVVTYAFATGDSLVIDMANKTVKINGVNRLDTITSGDFWAIDVLRDGDYLNGLWPQVLRSANFSVNNLTYKKAWR